MLFEELCSLPTLKIFNLVLTSPVATSVAGDGKHKKGRDRSYSTAISYSVPSSARFKHLGQRERPKAIAPFLADNTNCIGPSGAVLSQMFKSSTSRIARGRFARLA
jgi:hypothetical protein